MALPGYGAGVKFCEYGLHVGQIRGARFGVNPCWPSETNPARRFGMDWLLPACWVLSAVFVGWIFVGYPLSLLLKKSRPVIHKDTEGTKRCSVVIAAHNEEHTLPRKLRNLLQGADSKSIAEIWIGSDGSTDRTVEVVRAINDPRIRVWVSPHRRGKPALLNALIPRCSEDILVYGCPATFGTG